MFDKISDLATGSFIIFYVAMSHFMEAHVLCLLAIASGLHLVARSILGYSPLKLLFKKKIA